MEAATILCCVHNIGKKREIKAHDGGGSSRRIELVTAIPFASAIAYLILGSFKSGPTFISDPHNFGPLFFFIFLLFWDKLLISTPLSNTDPQKNKSSVQPKKKTPLFFFHIQIFQFYKNFCQTDILLKIL